ncbi:MAG TPA: OmpA family protein [Stellaceae bacterium]|nr:OmpA family protein [Stellaceae bacterium]
MPAKSLSSRSRTAAAVAVSVLALGLSSCVWKSDYDKVVAENQQLKQQLSESQAQQTFVEAGDLLFPPGGFQLSAAGQAELANNMVPRLKQFQNVKIVVYGYTDNTAIGPQLVAQGVPDNLVLSTRRAATVANFLIAQGINQNIISAKGFGETHPAASNDTPEGRAANRRIEITVQGPGALVGR